MTSILQSEQAVIPERKAAPTCPRPWLENPYRLVSLYEMLQVAAYRYLEMGRLIQDWTQGPLLVSAPAQPLNEKVYAEFVMALTALQLHSSELGLKVSEQLLYDTVRALKGTVLTREIAAKAMGEIYRCFLAELKSQAFFFVESHKSRIGHKVARSIRPTRANSPGNTTVW